MISVNVNIDTLVQLVVGVGSAVLAVLLMLIKIPQSDYSSKLSNSKLAIVVSFLICSFMMFYTIGQYGDDHIWDWEMFTMLTIYIVVHFSTSIISYSMISLLKTERSSRQSLFAPGLFTSAVFAFMLLESYRSGNMKYFAVVCVCALAAFLIQSVSYIVYFDKAYKQSLKDLENYYDEDESHKIKWVRFCYLIAMLTNLFVLVYIGLYWILDYKMEVTMAKNIQFSPELESFIEEWKNKPGNLIMILHRVQEEFGYISKEAACAVAERTNSTLARVFGVMTFYHFFKTQKPGKKQSLLCRLMQVSITLLI